MSQATSSGLPPPLITSSAYDAFVCSGCVRKIDTLRRYAGTPGVLMIIRDTPHDPWRVIGQLSSQHDTVDIETKTENGRATLIGEKRQRSDSAVSDQPVKRARQTSVEPNGHDPNGTANALPCLAPKPVSRAQTIFSGLDDPSTSASASVALGAGDIFLTEGWRDRWCHCNKVNC